MSQGLELVRGQIEDPCAEHALGPDLEEYRYMPLFNMGVALTYLKRFDEAKKSLDEAFSLYPDRMIQNQLSQTKSYRNLWEGRGTPGQN